MMTSPWFGQVLLFLYALIMAVGGTIGYFKAKSVASLMAGLISAIIILACLGFAMVGGWVRFGFGLGLFVAFVLVIFFGGRYLEKRKFMPSGLMAIISGVVGLLLILAIIMVRA